MAIANLMKPCNKTICPQIANHSIGTSVLSLAIFFILKNCRVEFFRLCAPQIIFLLLLLLLFYSSYTQIIFILSEMKCKKSPPPPSSIADKK